MATPSPDGVAASIQAYLASKGVPPAQTWLQTFMPTIKLHSPIVALQKTALFRILATDITSSLNKVTLQSLPGNITNPAVKEQTLRGPVTVQVLDVEDVGRSRWSQVEALEAHERGETTKGREVIRVVPDENAHPAESPSISSGPHKLLLQDANGTKLYAIELTPVNGVSVQMSIGTKLVLRDAVVARGMCLLENRNVEGLGGKVETWDKKWREERKSRLKQMAGMENGTGEG